MSDKCFSHASNFPAEWWNERRRRDYYVGEDGCVKLHPDSETGRKLAAVLFCEAQRYALELAIPLGNA